MGVLGGTWRTMFIAFLGLVHKVYACGLLAGLVISTTRVGEFLSAMARLHVPKRLTIPIAVMLRYLPAIREDWRFIKDAMRLRDVSPTLWGFLKAPAMTVNCIYVPLLTAASNAAVVLATFVYLLALDWRMALASLITFPLGMVFFMLMMAGYEKDYARTVAATNTLNDTAVEYIGGIEVIKVFGKAKSSYEKFVSAAKECAQSYIDWMNRSNFYFTFAMNIMPAALLTVLPIGGLLLKNGTLTAEKFIVILSMHLENFIFPAY